MNVTEKEIVIKEKIYELTEDELEDLKNEWFNKGRKCVLNYIGECWNNYIWIKNIKGCSNFISDLLRFCEGRGYIPNHYNTSIQEFYDNGERLN